MRVSVHDTKKSTVETQRTHGQHWEPGGERTNVELTCCWRSSRRSTEKGLPTAAGGKIPSELKVEA